MEISKIVIQSSKAWGGAMYSLPMNLVNLKQLLALLKKSQDSDWRVTFETNEGGILFPIVVANTLEFWASENYAKYKGFCIVQSATRKVRKTTNCVSDNAIALAQNGNPYEGLYNQFTKLYFTAIDEL